MFFFSDSFSQSLSTLLRPAVAAAALAGSGSSGSFRRLLAVVVPRVMLAVVGAALIAWALAMLALVG